MFIVTLIHTLPRRALKAVQICAEVIDEARALRRRTAKEHRVYSED
ncbi:hypothetical protein [Terrarubrum flagellatum]